ncbi:protein of unknown function [Paraburkholderia kururiensis]
MLQSRLVSEERCDGPAIPLMVFTARQARRLSIRSSFPYAARFARGQEAASNGAHVINF